MLGLRREADVHGRQVGSPVLASLSANVARWLERDGVHEGGVVQHAARLCGTLATARLRNKQAVNNNADSLSLLADSRCILVVRLFGSNAAGSADSPERGRAARDPVLRAACGNGSGRS